ncbi:unnamed protein product [Prunus armeniaca]
MAVAPTFVADITTGHGPFTATFPPTLTAFSSTPTPQPPSNCGKAFYAHDTCDTCWIIDSGATDHMTYNSTLFSTTLPPYRDHILTANNVVAPVMGADSILFTPTLPLNKVLLIPSLSSGIQTREIFGRGTKKGGLYYMDDVATSRVLLARSAETSQHCRIWLLHCRFGHASFGYLRCLVVSSMFTSIITKGVSWTPMLSAMSFWVSLLIKKATDASVLQPDVSMSLWMLPLLRMKCSSLIHPEHVLQGETSSEGHNWLNLQGGVVLDSLIQREEPTEPAELAEPD